MSNPLWGLVGVVAFGRVSAGMMLPMSFPDKRDAILGAFLNRFAIGWSSAVSSFVWPGRAVGLFFGLLLSLPDAIITKAYVPIIVIGALGGVLIGGFIHGWTIRS